MSTALRSVSQAIVRRFAAASPGSVRAIAITGGVAVGKSHFARRLQRSLIRLLHEPVELVSTDGFLRSDADLLRAGMLDRKGFPESYDHRALERFCAALQASERCVEVPVYSHEHRGVVAHRRIDVPRWLIVEGVYALQPLRDSGVPHVSIFLSADRSAIERWYVERFLRLRSEPGAAVEELEQRAKQTYARVNAVNYEVNIAPLSAGADLVLHKRSDHGLSLALPPRRGELQALVAASISAAS